MDQARRNEAAKARQAEDAEIGRREQAAEAQRHKDAELKRYLGLDGLRRDKDRCTASNRRIPNRAIELVPYPRPQQNMSNLTTAGLDGEQSDQMESGTFSVEHVEGNEGHQDAPAGKQTKVDDWKMGPPPPPPPPEYESNLIEGDWTEEELDKLRVENKRHARSEGSDIHSLFSDGGGPNDDPYRDVEFHSDLQYQDSNRGVDTTLQDPNHNFDPKLVDAEHKGDPAKLDEDHNYDVDQYMLDGDPDDYDPNMLENSGFFVDAPEDPALQGITGGLAKTTLWPAIPPPTPLKLALSPAAPPSPTFQPLPVYQPTRSEPTDGMVFTGMARHGDAALSMMEQALRNRQRRAEPAATFSFGRKVKALVEKQVAASKSAAVR